MAVNGTAVWRVGPSGSNTNGGGYDPKITGAGSDFSQQNAAQASGTNGAAAANSTTFTDSTANAFNANMVGNAIWIASGTNFIVSAYFVTAFTSASTVTLDRAPATAGAGSAGAWKLGGRWADFWTNVTLSTNPIVGGNVIYILGSGTPNPASYTFDYTMGSAGLLAWPGLNPSGGISFQNDPATPGYQSYPSLTGGMPCINVTASLAITGVTSGGGSYLFRGLWFACGSLGSGQIINNSSTPIISFYMIGCVVDQAGSHSIIFNSTYSVATSGISWFFLGNEFFSSVASVTGTTSLFTINSGTSTGVVAAFIGNNFHDLNNVTSILNMGVSGTGTQANLVCINNIFANMSADVIFNDTFGNLLVMNNTFDTGTGNCINVGADQQNSYNVTILNNIFSNYTGAAKAAFNNTSGFANSFPTPFVDYNTFYNNTNNYTNVTGGAHDTFLQTSPYVSSSVENYTLA